MRINGDTGANYAMHTLTGNTSAITSAANSNTTGMGVLGAGLVPTSLAVANGFAGVIVDLVDAYSVKNRTVRSLSGFHFGSNGDLKLTSGLWRNTASLSSISFYLSEATGNYVAGSRFSLYGIRG
jgi:hypothetical protein